MTVIFNAYFDASGTKRMSALTATGFVSRVKKWDRFDEEWAKILKDEGVSAMHMTDFVSSKGEFANWRGQTDRRRDFIAALSECIRRNTNKGFGSSVILSDYNTLNKKFKLSEHAGQPYTLAMRSCLGGLRKWARKKHIKIEDMLVAIEDGDEDSGELIQAARADGFKIVPLPKADAIAFQAADVAAWKFRTAIHNAIYGPMADEKDAERILRSMNPIKMTVRKNGVHNRDALLFVCQKGNIPLR